MQYVALISMFVCLFVCKKTSLFQAIQFSQTVLIRTIQVYWLFGFYGISTFEDNLMLNPFLYK